MFYAPGETRTRKALGRQILSLMCIPIPPQERSYYKWAVWDLNPRSHDYESRALTN